MKKNVHPSAEVSDEAKIGKNVKIWNESQIREKAVIGNNTIIGKNVYIDKGVQIGKNCKIGNNVSIFAGVEIRNGVFVGPHVCFTNDKYPRAVTPQEKLKDTSDWTISPIIIESGASIGANATILPGVTVGKWAMIGAGAVVTKDVDEFTLVYGSPAQSIGKVNKEGKLIKDAI